MKGAESSWPRFLITAALVLLVVWGLVLVSDNLATAVVKDENGNVVDAYQRASDVLHTMLPLLTIALGYWFGAAGKEKAEQQTVAAQTDAHATRQRLEAVLGVASDQDLLTRARAASPEAFTSEPPC